MSLTDWLDDLRSRLGIRKRYRTRKSSRSQHAIPAIVQSLEPRTLLSTISLVASDPNASETGPDNGEFLIMRDGDTANALTVNYTISGTATNGVDYATLSGSTTIAAGANSASLNVAPVADGVAESNETVSLTLSTNANYDISTTNSSGTVTISESTQPATFTIAGVSNVTEDPTDGDQNHAVYVITRGGSLSAGQTASVNVTQNLNQTDAADFSTNVSQAISTAVASTPGVSWDGTTLTFAQGGPTSSSSSKYAGSVTSSGLWTNSQNAVGNNSSTYALADADKNDSTGNLVLTNYGFNVPTNATITGLTVTLNTSGSSVSAFPVIQLTKNGSSQSGSTLMSATGWNTGSVSAGDSTNLWGTTWTPADINADTFGVIINESSTADGSVFKLRSANIVVSYTTPGISAPVSLMFTTQIASDAIAEGSEAYAISLSNPTTTNANGAVLGNAASVTTTIVDTPITTPEISVSATDPNASEIGPDAGTFTLTRTGDTTDALTVNYTVSGTATLGSDYTALSGAVTFAAGSSTATVDVIPLTDSTLESTETVILTLLSDVAYTIDGLADSASVSIADGTPTVSISATDATAAEDDADTGTFTFTRTGNIIDALTVGYSVSGSATSGVDYDALSGFVTIAAGQSAATVTINPHPDANASEGNETATLTLSSGSMYLVSVESDHATVTVTDGESTIPRVSILATDPTASEAGADPGLFTVTRTGGTSESLVVDYTITGLATNGVDYGSLSGTVTIDAGQSSATIQITPLGDTLQEGVESVSLALTAGADYDVDPAAAMASLTIQDAVTVSLLATDGIASEYGLDHGTILVTRTGDTSSTLTVNYTVSGSATNGDDYELLLGSVTFAAGVETATIDVAPLADTAAEGPESVVVTLLSSADYLVALGSDQATVSIADDVAYLSVTATDSAASETGPDNGVFTIARTGETETELTIAYALSGTATNGNDFYALSGTITMAVGQTSVTIDVVPLADTFEEPTESVVLTLQAGAGYAIQSGSSQATIQIADALPALSIAATNATAAELGPEEGLFTVTRSGSLANDLTVTYTVTGTAINGIDYETLSGSVTILAGQASASIQVMPVVDALSEDPETVVVALEAVTGYTLASGAAQATVTLADAPVVSITATTPDASEVGPSSGHFTLVRTGSTDQPVVVNYIVAGTAENGTDYVTIQNSAVIDAGNSSVTIEITPLADSLIENEETVILTLSSAEGYNVLPSASQATVTISDAPVVSITATDAHAGEVGPDSGTFTITRTGDTGESLTVSYTISGTAANGIDYANLTGIAVIAAGANSTTVSVVPSADSASEGNETVIVTIAAGTGYQVSSSAPQATVTIGDTPTVSIEASDASASELASHPGVFTLTRTGNISDALSVNYTVSGTATNGDDYTTLTGIATFAAGSTTTTITVTPVADTLEEGSETVVVSLSSGSDYMVSTSANQATVTIADAPTVSIVASSPNADESDSVPGTFTITRTGSTTSALVVNYSVGGTATNVQDYELLNGTVTIAAGDSSATISVIPRIDTILEGEETVVVTLTLGAEYNVAPNAADATVTIADDPNQPPEFGAQSYSFSISSNSETGHVVGLLTATDPQGDAFTFSLTGNNNPPFAIDAQSGVITYIGTETLLAGMTYSFTAWADDSQEVSQVSVTVLIVPPPNDPPVFSNPSYDWVLDSRTVAATIVGTVSATDPESQPLTYSLTGTGPFFIDAQSGEVTYTGTDPLMVGQTYELTATASDGVKTTDVTISLLINDRPEFTAASFQFDVASDTWVNSVIGQVSASDADHDWMNYSLTGSSIFAVNAITGILYLTDPTGLEAGQSYQLTVTAQDGYYTITTQVTITIVDPAWNQLEFLAGTFQFQANVEAQAGEEIGVAATWNAQQNSGLTYSLTGTGPFTINASTGQIQYNGSASLAVGQVYNLTASVTNGTATATCQIAVRVTLANQAPVFHNASSALEVRVNSLSGAIVGLVNAYDPNGDALTYSMTGSSLLQIDPQSGRILRAPNAVLTVGQTFQIAVTASDGLVSTTITKDVVVVAPPPQFDSRAYGFTVGADEDAGHLIGTLTATPWPGMSMTYQDVSMPTVFDMSSVTGEITLRDASSALVGQTFQFYVEVTDGYSIDLARVTISVVETATGTSGSGSGTTGADPNPPGEDLTPYLDYAQFYGDVLAPYFTLPTLGDTPEYLSQTELSQTHLSEFDNLAAGGPMDQTTVTHEDTTDTQTVLEGTLTTETQIDSLLTEYRSDVAADGSWLYSRAFTSLYTITTTFSDTVHGITFTTVQAGSRDYQYDYYVTATTAGLISGYSLHDFAADTFGFDLYKNQITPGTTIGAVNETVEDHLEGQQGYQFDGTGYTKTDTDGTELQQLQEHRYSAHASAGYDVEASIDDTSVGTAPSAVLTVYTFVGEDHWSIQAERGTFTDINGANDLWEAETLTGGGTSEEQLTITTAIDDLQTNSTLPVLISGTSVPSPVTTVTTTVETGLSDDHSWDVYSFSGTENQRQGSSSIPFVNWDNYGVVTPEARASASYTYTDSSHGVSTVDDDLSITTDVSSANGSSTETFSSLVTSSETWLATTTAGGSGAENVDGIWVGTGQRIDHSEGDSVSDTTSDATGSSQYDENGITTSTTSTSSSASHDETPLWTSDDTLHTSLVGDVHASDWDGHDESAGSSSWISDDDFRIFIQDATDPDTVTNSHLISTSQDVGSEDYVSTSNRSGNSTSNEATGAYSTHSETGYDDQILDGTESTTSSNESYLSTERNVSAVDFDHLLMTQIVTSQTDATWANHAWGTSALDVTNTPTDLNQDGTIDPEETVFTFHLVQLDQHDDVGEDDTIDQSSSSSTEQASIPIVPGGTTKIEVWAGDQADQESQSTQQVHSFGWTSVDVLDGQSAFDQQIIAYPTGFDSNHPIPLPEIVFTLTSADTLITDEDVSGTHAQSSSRTEKITDANIDLLAQQPVALTGLTYLGGSISYDRNAPFSSHDDGPDPQAISNQAGYQYLSTTTNSDQGTDSSHSHLTTVDQTFQDGTTQVSIQGTSSSHTDAVIAQTSHTELQELDPNAEKREFANRWKPLVQADTANLVTYQLSDDNYSGLKTIDSLSTQDLVIVEPPAEPDGWRTNSSGLVNLSSPGNSAPHSQGITGTSSSSFTIYEEGNFTTHQEAEATLTSEGITDIQSAANFTGTRIDQFSDNESYVFLTNDQVAALIAVSTSSYEDSQYDQKNRTISQNGSSSDPETISIVDTLTASGQIVLDSQRTDTVEKEADGSITASSVNQLDTLRTNQFAMSWIFDQFSNLSILSDDSYSTKIRYSQAGQRDETTHATETMNQTSDPNTGIETETRLNEASYDFNESGKTSYWIGVSSNNSGALMSMYYSQQSTYDTDGNGTWTGIPSPASVPLQTDSSTSHYHTEKTDVSNRGMSILSDTPSSSFALTYMESSVANHQMLNDKVNGVDTVLDQRDETTNSTDSHVFYAYTGAHGTIHYHRDQHSRSHTIQEESLDQSLLTYSGSSSSSSQNDTTEDDHQGYYANSTTSTQSANHSIGRTVNKLTGDVTVQNDSLSHTQTNSTSSGDDGPSQSQAVTDLTTRTGTGGTSIETQSSSQSSGTNSAGSWNDSSVGNWVSTPVTTANASLVTAVPSQPSPGNDVYHTPLHSSEPSVASNASTFSNTAQNFNETNHGASPVFAETAGAPTLANGTFFQFNHHHAMSGLYQPGLNQTPAPEFKGPGGLGKTVPKSGMTELLDNVPNRDLHSSIPPNAEVGMLDPYAGVVQRVVEGKTYYAPVALVQNEIASDDHYKSGWDSWFKTYGQRGVRGMFKAAMVSQYFEQATGSFFYDPPAMPSFSDFAKGLNALGQVLQTSDPILNWGNNLLGDLMDWMQNDDTPGQAMFFVPPEQVPDPPPPKIVPAPGLIITPDGKEIVDGMEKQEYFKKKIFPLMEQISRLQKLIEVETDPDRKLSLQKSQQQFLDILKLEYTKLGIDPEKLIETLKGATPEDPVELTTSEYFCAAYALTFAGDWAEVPVTGLGVTGSLLFAFTGFDFYKDFGDIGHGITHWENSWSHMGFMALNVAALFPVIGMVKNAKHLDELSDAAAAARQLDKASSAAKAVAPNSVSKTLQNLKGVPWGKYVANGCENVAKKIQSAIGGTIHRIKPHSSLPGTPQLGPRSGQATGWFYHEVVVKDGRVYDALTGPKGLAIDEFKKLWEYADAIDFGF